MVNWEKTFCQTCSYPIYYLKSWKKLPICKSCYLFNLDLKSIVNHLEKINKKNKSTKNQSLFLELKDLIIRFGKNRRNLSKKLANNKKVYTLIKDTENNIFSKDINLLNANKVNKIKKVKYKNYIQKNIDEINEQHQFASFKLKKLNKIKKAKYFWLKYNSNINLDSISLEDLTGLSNRQQIEFETELGNGSNSDLSEYFQNLNKEDYYISDLDIDKQKNLSINRRKLQIKEQNKQSNETYIDYLKKGANLYEN